MLKKCFYTCLLMLLFYEYKASAQSTRLFLVAGQSNCVGMGDSSLSVDCDPLMAFEYRAMNDTLVPLRDPTGENYLNFQRARSGSAWPAFAQQYHRITKDKVIIIPAARNGSSCHRKAELPGDGTWDTSGKRLLFRNAIAKTKKAEHKTGLSLSGIIWIQGERDANAINKGELSIDEYKASLQDLVLRFRKELGESVPFYIVRTGLYVGHPEDGFDKVQRVQRSLAKKRRDIFIVYKDTDKFPTRQWMKKDGIHYTQPAYNDIGRTIATYIARLGRH